MKEELGVMKEDAAWCGLAVAEGTGSAAGFGSSNLIGFTTETADLGCHGGEVWALRQLLQQAARCGLRYVSEVAPWRCDPQGPIKVPTYIWRPERRNDVVGVKISLEIRAGA